MKKVTKHRATVLAAAITTTFALGCVGPDNGILADNQMGRALGLAGQDARKRFAENHRDGPADTFFQKNAQPPVVTLGVTFDTIAGQGCGQGVHDDDR